MRPETGHLRRASALGVMLLSLAFLLLFAWIDRPEGPDPVAARGAIEELFDGHRSGVVVESAGVVIAVLPDDLKGSRHQRFILRLESGHSLLISHNIDLAPRVEALARGDEVAFRGQYEWNDRGGVIHWTHHDPDGGRPGGWLAHAGRIYR